jgi:hypothetical protein
MINTCRKVPLQVNFLYNAIILLWCLNSKLVHGDKYQTGWHRNAGWQNFLEFINKFRKTAAYTIFLSLSLGYTYEDTFLRLVRGCTLLMLL